jgi:hypothetical protein
MSRPTPPCGLALAFAMFLAAPGASAADDQILARVDGQLIYAWDAEHFVSAEADGRASENEPRQDGPQRARASAKTWAELRQRNARNLESLVDRKLLLGECRRTGRATRDAAVLRLARERFPYEWLDVPRGLRIDLTDGEYDSFRPSGPWRRRIPHDPTEPEIDATRERLCLDRLLAAEATAPVRRAEARAWYLAHPVERSMRAEGPAATRARIVDRLRLRAKIQRAPQPPAFTPPRRGSRSAPHR